ncbi:hypothetical protein BGZ80_000852 [Entomortierella chlamydospora]|uniref:F-box domain protein n=1 Tax=Entomortierella chlamydospora TaxID=101097 RepID=A0A9P6SYD1_9FUNG|nr:hypothetical protein BGZ79_000819 [Entomortierella chlamydospora]KAG0011206.1 hypothetical protein BGZ80_000852 [Entomortierella chlamydospora]
MNLILDPPTKYVSDSKPEEDPFNLIACNPSLVKLSIIRLKGYFQDPFWDAVSKLQSLTTLHLQFVNIVPNDTFWTVCRNLETLHLVGTVFLGDHIVIPDQSFPRMRSLSISNVDNLDMMKQVKFLRQCGNMEELTWRGRCSFQALQEFTQDLVQGAWPKLESFDPGFNIPHPLLAQIFGGMRRITKLFLTRTTIKPSTFQYLRPHLDSLVVLDHRGSTGPSSDMLREIMCSCPNLEELRSGSIIANDVLQDEPWVCTNLKIIQVCFLFDKSRSNADTHRTIFKRISGLTQLERLQVGGWSSGPNIPFQESLDLRLESGLGELANLKHIKCLDFFHTVQMFGEEDVRWIISNWRKLEETLGCVHPNPKERDILVSLFKERGIKAV